MKDYYLFMKHYPEGKAEQQTYCGFFGDREYDLLTKKKNDFLYNLLYKLSYATANKSYDECSHEVKHKLDLTAKKIVELSGDNDVHLSYTYLSILTIKNHRKGRVLLFRVLGGRYLKTTYFVEEEPDGRVYQGWEDYLTNCKLPDCIMLVPKNGFHHSIDGIAEVELIRSPSNSITECLNNISNIATVASTGIAVASTFTPVIGAPFLIGSGIVLGINAICNTISTVSELADRINHHQSISPLNKDAGLLYFNNLCHLTGSISVASSLVSKSSSNEISARMTNANILGIISVSLQSYSIINNIAGLVIKFKNGSIPQQDLNSLKHLCFLVANISLESGMIRTLLSLISDCPRMLLNVFNMTRNTLYSFTKCIRNGLVLGIEVVLDVLMGPMCNKLLRSCDMPVTAKFISNCKRFIDEIRKNKNVNYGKMGSCILENYKFLDDFKREIQMAYKKFEEVIIMSGKKVKLSLTSDQDSLNVVPAKIRDEVNLLVNEINISNSDIREECRKKVSDVIAHISSKVNISNADQLIQLCELFRNKIWSRYETRMLTYKILPKILKDKCFFDELYCKDSNKSKTLLEHLEHFKNFDKNSVVKRKLLYECLSEKAVEDLCSEIPLDSMDTLPLLYEHDNDKIFLFSCAENDEIFYNFVHCTACKLLNTDEFEKIWSSLLSKKCTENLILVGSKDQTVMFFYSYDQLCTCYLGITILLKNK